MTEERERLDDVLAERDFLRRLLELGRATELEPVLQIALELLGEVSAARITYVEVFAEDDTQSPGWAAIDGGAAPADEIRSAISRGIIDEAVSSGRAVATASARDDPRFSDSESVRAQHIEAVLCVPIGSDPALGVIYLQGDRRTGGFSPYSPRTTALVGLLANALVPTARALRARAARPGETAATVGGPAFAAVIGRSRALVEAVRRLHLAAPLDVHILLTGPSGTGKTLLARAIHAASPRRAQPFTELNCATIPEALLENELFGAEPGGHSAAGPTGVRGKVEASEGGTLLLDEVAELPLAAQAKLLTLLQSKTFYRLGGSSPRRADVRIIAATNVDLPRAVQERRMREDLYYRLCVLEVQVPGLDERTEDIPLLAASFCEAICRRDGIKTLELTSAAMQALMTAGWPGHVRQLENRIEQAVVNARLRAAATIDLRDLFPERPATAPEAASLQEATRRFQLEHVRATLAAHDWNVTEAARRLDVSRSHLYNLIRAFDLRRA